MHQSRKHGQQIITDFFPCPLLSLVPRDGNDSHGAATVDYLLPCLILSLLLDGRTESQTHARHAHLREPPFHRAASAVLQSHLFPTDSLPWEVWPFKSAGYRSVSEFPQKCREGRRFEGGASLYSLCRVCVPLPSKHLHGTGLV